MGIISPPTIVPFRGYGNPEKVYVHGAVVENRPIFSAHAQHGKRKNFRTMLSRYLSTPLSGTEVHITFGNQTYKAVTNREGYFNIWIYPQNSLSSGWHSLHYAIEQREDATTCQGDFLIVDAATRFGVISDIDDTILISHATRWFKKLRLILTKNAKTRLVFKGMPEFYQKLKGKKNPIFYVSSSEWNLYDFLVDLFDERQIPKGPIMLQDYKSGLWELIFSGGGNHGHKEDKIIGIMQLFPFLSFILIGDSGQNDVEIYRRILQVFPKRIKAVYIRKIGKKDTLDRVTQQEFKDKGIDLLLLKDTEEAEGHARKMGYIPN